MAAKGQEIGTVEMAALLDSSPAELKRLATRGVIPAAKDGRLPMVATIRAYVVHARDPKLSVEECATALGVSRAWVRKLCAEKVIQQDRNGLIQQSAACAAYLRWLRDENRLSARGNADAALRDAKRQKIELDLATRAGELIPTETALSTVDYVLAGLRTDLDGMGARITRDIALRRQIESEVDATLAKACARLEAASAMVRAGRDPLEEEAEVLAPPSYRRGRKKASK